MMLEDAMMHMMLEDAHSLRICTRCQSFMANKYLLSCSAAEVIKFKLLNTVR